MSEKKELSIEELEKVTGGFEWGDNNWSTAKPWYACFWQDQEYGYGTRGLGYYATYTEAESSTIEYAEWLSQSPLVFKMKIFYKKDASSQEEEVYCKEYDYFTGFDFSTLK